MIAHTPSIIMDGLSLQAQRFSECILPPSQEKAQVAATSLEKVFAELVSLTEGLQTKASAASVAQVCTTRSGG